MSVTSLLFLPDYKHYGPLPQKFWSCYYEIALFSVLYLTLKGEGGIKGGKKPTVPP